MERTFIAIKPDAVQRGLIGQIVQRFETRGYKLVGMKLMQASKELAEKHYGDLSDKPFFPGLVEFLSSSPLVAMVWEGEGVVKTARTMIGETAPQASAPGTIRGDYAIVVGRNVIHGSDSVKSAEKEIALWFKEEELVNWTPQMTTWVYED